MSPWDVRGGDPQESTKMGQGGGWAGDRDGCLSFQKKNKFPLRIVQPNNTNTLKFSHLPNLAPAVSQTLVMRSRCTPARSPTDLACTNR